MVRPRILYHFTSTTGNLCFGYRYRIDHLSIRQETFDRYLFIRHPHGEIIIRFGLGSHYLIQLMVNP